MVSPGYLQDVIFYEVFGFGWLGKTYVPWALYQYARIALCSSFSVFISQKQKQNQKFKTFGIT